MTTKLQFRIVLSRSIRSGALLLLVVVLAGTGCLSKPPLKRQTFAFQNPPAAPMGSRGGSVAVVRSVTVSPLFSKDGFVYRIGPELYETDSYAGFLVPPHQAFAIAIRSQLLHSGTFRDVLEPGSRQKADQYIDVYVSELCGDFSQSGQAAAVLSIQLTLFDSEATRDPVLQESYSRRMPLDKNTAAAVVAGWDKALGEMISEFAAGLAGGNRP